MKLFNRLKSLTVALVMTGGIASLVGCGGDSDGPFTNLQGIYEVTGWNENDSSCEADGPSVLADKIEKFVLVKEGMFFTKFLTAVTCSSLEVCREDAVDDTIDLTGFLFESGSDSDGWVGRSASASGLGDDTCTGIYSQYTMTSPEPNVVQIVAVTHQVTGVSEDSDGFCDTDEVMSRGPSEPCASREVIRASFVEGL